MDIDDSTPFRPVIRSQADLEGVWRHLMEPLGFSATTLWFLLIEPDGRPVPIVHEVVELDGLPGAEGLEGLASLVGQLADLAGSGARIAFLLSRPGRHGLTRDDRAWAAALYDGCRRAGLPCETVHVATDARLVPVPLDELARTA